MRQFHQAISDETKAPLPLSLDSEKMLLPL